VDVIPAEPDTHHTHDVTCKTRVTDESHRCAGISKHKKKIDMKMGKKINFCAFFFSSCLLTLKNATLAAAGQRFYFSRSFSEKKKMKKTVRKVRFLGWNFSFVFAAPLPSSNDSGKTKCEVMCTTGSEIDDCQCARIF
jgi:hypothetical protein